MIAIVAIITAALVGLILWFLLKPQEMNVDSGYYDDSIGFEFEPGLTIAAQTDLEEQGLQVVTRGGVSAIVQSRPKFIHTVQSATSFAWLNAFLASAQEAGIYNLKSVQQALGRPDTSPWQFAEASLNIAAPASSVIVPTITSGALATGTLIAAPASSVIALFSTLDALDKEIKRRIVEAEICLTFVNAFVKEVSLPPMGLLNALANMVSDSGNYSAIRGFGSAMDRTKEPGVGIVRDMILLYEEVANRGWMAGVPTLTNLPLYNQMIAKREISIPLNNNKTRLQPTGSGFSGYVTNKQGKSVKVGEKGGRGFFWARYVYSVDKLFATVETPKWKKGFSEKEYKKALALVFKRTGNPCQFDKEAMSDWLNRGGIYTGTFKGYIQPPIVNFSLGHNPGLGGYRGLDTGFSGIPLANETQPNWNENTWKSRFDIDTNGGWCFVY